MTSDIKERITNLLSREFITSLVQMFLLTWVFKSMNQTTENFIIYSLAITGGLVNYVVNRTMQKRNNIS